MGEDTRTTRSRLYPKDVAGQEVPAKSVRHPTSTRLHALLDELGELHDRKQRDYGTAADPLANVRAAREWGIPPWVAALARASDKFRRLQVYASKGVLQNESAFDSLKDIAVYVLIAYILLEEQEVSHSSTLLG